MATLAAVSGLGPAVMAGIIGGLIFAVFEMMMAAVMMGAEAAFMPLRMIGGMPDPAVESAARDVQGSDGLQALGGNGTEYQAYVELVTVSKTTGSWSRVARFDSNLQCSATPERCQGDNTVKTFAVPFNHTFNFENYTYAVYARLYRALAIWGLTPQIYQLRLKAAPLSTSPGA